MKQTFLIAAVISALSLSVHATESAKPVAAQPVKTTEATVHPKPETVRSINPGDISKLWDSLTKAEKIKALEDRRALKIKKEADKWNKMTDDEKIAQYDKRRKTALAMKGKKAAKQDACDKKIAELKAKYETPAKSDASEPAKKPEQPKPMPVKQ